MRLHEKKPVSSHQQLHTFRQALAIEGVPRLWTGQLISLAGDFLAMFAVLGLASFRMHATPAQITGITVSYMLPLATLGPVAGVFVDRWNPRHTMIASDLIRAALATLLMMATRPAGICAVLFAISAVSTFFIPAQSRLIRTLVPREALLSVNAILQQAMLAIRLASPAIAGALVARFGPMPCFYLDAFSFIFSALMISGVRTPAGVAGSSARSIRADLSAGVRFILTHSAVSFALIAMASATFAISCFAPLIAIFVRDILHADVRTFGVISAMIGLGMIAGTQSVRPLVLRRPPRHVVVFSLAVMAAGIVLMGASRLALATAAGALVMGCGVGLLMVPAQTLIQSETPIPLAGRVSSGVMSLISVAQILGLTLSSVFSGVIGVRKMFFSSALLLGGLALAGLRKKVPAPLT